MKKTLTTLALGLAAAVAASSASAMTITAMDNADNLANNILGSGVTISNVSYTGVNAASGYFSGGTAAGIGIESGIVLTSGYASNLNGTSNTSDYITGANGQPGDSDLDGLIPGYDTYDATVLEFDFQIDALTTGATTGGAYFQYVFGSEEYNEYVGSSYNDVFGFFMGGTGGTNHALIPGTTTPVAINNVNNGSYPAYYNDNDPNDTSVPFAFEYDGFTDVFQASFTGLNVGQSYTVKLAIADAGDHILDSGVFLKGSSFSNEPIPEPATMLLMGTGLSGLIAVRRRKAAKKA